MSRGQITRFLPDAPYQGAINANSPSAVNPFATIADLANADNIYNTSDSLTGNRVLSGTLAFFNLNFASLGAFDVEATDGNEETTIDMNPGSMRMRYDDTAGTATADIEITNQINMSVSDSGSGSDTYSGLFAYNFGRHRYQDGSFTADFNMSATGFQMSIENDTTSDRAQISVNDNNTTAQMLVYDDSSSNETKFTMENGSTIFDDAIGDQGMAYNADYSTNGVNNYGNRWIPDVGWVLSDANGIYSGSGTVPSNTDVTLTNSLDWIAPNATTTLHIMKEVAATVASWGFRAGEGGVLELYPDGASSIRTKMSGQIAGRSYINAGNNNGIFTINTGSTALDAPVNIVVNNPGGITHNNTMMVSSGTGSATLRVHGTGNDGRLDISSWNNANNPQNYRLFSFESLSDAANGFHSFKGWNDNNALGRALARTTVRQEYWRATSAAFWINPTANDYDFVVWDDAGNDMIYGDASTGAVGIGIQPVNSEFEVAGSIEAVGSGEGFIAEADDGNRVLMQLVHTGGGNYAWDTGTIV